MAKRKWTRKFGWFWAPRCRAFARRAAGGVMVKVEARRATTRRDIGR